MNKFILVCIMLLTGCSQPPHKDSDWDMYRETQKCVSPIKVERNIVNSKCPVYRGVSVDCLKVVYHKTYKCTDGYTFTIDTIPSVEDSE